MRILLKNISVWFLMAVAVLLLSRCDTPAVDTPVDPPVETPEGPGDPDDPDDPDPSLDDLSLYEAFKTQFDGGCAMEGFLIEGSGRYKVVFDDDRTRTFSTGEVGVEICTADAWPAVKVKGGVWYVGVKNTGIHYADSREDEEIVLVMYDTEGLYVRLSSGYMFFFHTGRVADIGCFRFEKALNPSLREDVVCTVGSGAISGRLDPATTDFNLIATAASRGTLVAHNGEYTDLRSSVTTLDYSEKVSLVLEKDENTSTLFNVTLEAVGSVPVLYIDTGSTKKGNIPLNDYVGAVMRLHNPDGVYSDPLDETFDIQIHGRGNTTWGMPKKPYKIKLAEKTRLLGMSNSKHWVLLANYSDKTLLRNALAFKLSELAGMPWAVRSRPVEVYMKDNSTGGNYSYEGLYQLTEHVRVDPERIDLDLVTGADNAGEAVTGGYLLWIDSKGMDKGYAGFYTSSQGMPVVYEDPEDLTAEQQTYIKNFVNQAESAIYNKGYKDFSQYIDVDSFIAYFFVTELAKDVDGDMRLSTYMTKPRGGKLGFPCVWDFDIAFGNCNYNGSGNGPTGWHIRNCRWFRPLFKDADFAARVAVKWAELYPKLAGAEAEMRAMARFFDDAQKHNFNKWRIIGTHVWPNYVVKDSYQAELDYMLSDFFMTRVAWMNAEITAGRHKL